MECHLPVLSGLFFSLTDCFPVGCQTLNVLAQQAEDQSQLTGPPAAGVEQKDLGGAQDFVLSATGRLPVQGNALHRKG